MDVYKGGGPTKLNPRGMAVNFSKDAFALISGLCRSWRPGAVMATLEQQLVASIAAVNFQKGEKAMINGKENGAGVVGTPTQGPFEEGKYQERYQEKNSRTRLPAELARALHAPLPAEAIKPHPSKPYLSSVKAIFVVERLNEVFGLGGWTYRVHVTESDPARAMVVVRVVLTVAEYGIRLEAAATTRTAATPIRAR
jgi:hypothetical protein